MMEVEQMVVTVLLVIMSAAISESFLEYILAPAINLIIADTEANKPKRTVIFNTLSTFLGVGICVNFQFGFYSMWGAAGFLQWVDFVLTGTVVGRGADFAHQFVVQYVFKKE